MHHALRLSVSPCMRRWCQLAMPTSRFSLTGSLDISTFRLSTSKYRQHVYHLRPHLPHISHMSLHSFASHFFVTCHSLTHTLNITALISLGHYIRILPHHEIFLTHSHTLNTLISFASPLISCSFPLPLPSLFPTMPRHNFYAATPYIKQFCNKYGLEYNLKPVFTAFADIVR